MDKINIGPDKVRERANQFRELMQQLQDSNAKMDSYMNSLRIEWEGESSAAFDEKYQQIRPGFTTAVDLLEDIACSLDKNANRFEDVDRYLAGQFGN